MRTALYIGSGLALSLSMASGALALSSQTSSQPIEFFRGVGDNGSHYGQVIGTSSATAAPVQTHTPAPAPNVKKTSQPIEFFRGVGDNGSHYGAIN